MATAYLEKIPLTTLRLMTPANWDVYQDACEWAILDRNLKVIRRGKDLLDSLPQCDEVEVVIPASMVGFITAQLPPGSQSKILGALAYLVEAGLISAPEDTHAVLAEQADANVVVAVMQKSLLKLLLEKLSRATIFPDRLYPETVLPTMPQNAWALVSRGHESFLKTSIAQGIPITVESNSETPPLLLALALQQCEPTKSPVSIVLYGDPVPQREAWQEQLGISIVSAMQQEWFVNDSRPVLNLLQGEFKPSGGVMRRLVAFKPVAITFCVLIALHVGLTLLDYGLKASENRQLDHAMLLQYKATFPNANTIVDAPLQMQRNLEELKHGIGEGTTSDYIPLLAAVTNSIGTISSERLRGMDYRNNKLIFSLLLPDIALAEAMRKRLSSNGLMATIDSLVKTDQGVEMLFTVMVSAS